MSKCFAFREECKILTRTDCSNCAFYKTKAQLTEGRVKALKKLERLDKNLRDLLVEKYYRGQVPSYEEED